jgi:hypothetical protein
MYARIMFDSKETKTTNVTIGMPDNRKWDIKYARELDRDEKFPAKPERSRFKCNIKWNREK